MIAEIDQGSSVGVPMDRTNDQPIHGWRIPCDYHETAYRHDGYRIDADNLPGKDSQVQIVTDDIGIS